MLNKQSTEKGISWTDLTWNPLVGCKAISKACRNCWALVFARRMSVNSRTPYYKGTVDSGQWTGKSNFIEDKLLVPLKIKEPTRIAAVLMGDPFLGPQNFKPLEKIHTIAKMAPQHTFIFLTKRPAIAGTFYRSRFMRNVIGWPLPNVWIGISAEDDETLVKRARLLLEIEAAVHILSYEPALGDLPSLPNFLVEDKNLARFKWILAGAQSGPGSEPCPADRIRFVRDACVRFGVKFHFKGWGSFLPEVEYIEKFGPGKRAKRVEFNGAFYYRMSKEKSGRILDGREWIEFPELVPREFLTSEGAAEKSLADLQEQKKQRPIPFEATDEKQDPSI